MKKLLICVLVLLCLVPAVLAEDAVAPVLRMGLSQTRFTGPQDVTVTISVTNPSEEPLGPMALYWPNGKIIEEFGTPTLEACETRNWEGIWCVTEEQLKQGRVVFAIQYMANEAHGSFSRKTQPYYVSISWEKKLPQMAEIILKGNPSTGYSWDWQGISGDDCIKINCETKPVNDDPELVGGPVRYIYTVEGTQPGFVEICFTYARPWEHDPTMALYHLYYDIRVDEDLNVTILGSRFDW